MDDDVFNKFHCRAYNPHNFFNHVKRLKMSALVCGALAYDTIMVFPDRFRNHILPEKVHILNVTFAVPEMHKEFGGCAGNIAYNLHLLGGDGFAMGTVGRDFSSYSDWMDQCGLDRRYIKVIEDEYTAQAFITTDLDDNQITAFHPGAVNRSHANRIPVQDGITLSVLSPDGKEGMLQHARQCSEAGIPFIFDPGPSIPMFNGDELLSFIEQADYLCVNGYELQLLQRQTDLTAKRIAQRVKAAIVTHGKKGSVIHTPEKSIEIPPVKVDRVQDPTGCGDAYRGGIIYGLMNDLDWRVTGHIATLMGAIKVTYPGTQNHRFTPSEFKERFKREFGYSF